jgi:hypothetical protein
MIPLLFSLTDFTITLFPFFCIIPLRGRTGGDRKGTIIVPLQESGVEPPRSKGKYAGPKPAQRTPRNGKS